MQAWFCDGSKTQEGSGWGKAGAAVCNGDFEVLARVPGPQTSYRAELFGALLAAMHASPFSTIILDNKAVVDGGWADLSREVSDLDLRSKLQTLLVEKCLTLHWVPSHRTVQPTQSAEERHVIQQNNRVDLLAKRATTLSQQCLSPTEPSDIFVCGGQAPIPARKCILLRRRAGTWEGVHWTTWLPLRGQRRMLWLQWLWGHVRWMGCGAPWSKQRPPCNLCQNSHLETVHGKL